MSEFFEIFAPGLRHLREQRDLEKVLVVDDAKGGSGPRPLDLDSGSVVLRMPGRAAGTTKPATPATYAAAMDPQLPGPNTRDWTFVEKEPCPECGYDASTIDPSDVGARLPADTAGWTAILARPDAAVRPSPTVWSPLEYACHVRDVLLVFTQRLGMMLTQVNPRFANWDQDATAVADRYWEQNPAAVAAQVDEAACTLAQLWSEVREDEWTRKGTRSDGAEFTVASLGVYLLHELRHHLADVS